jgi:hypothetical protein
MKNYKFLFGLLLCLFSFHCVHAQDSKVKVTFGPVYENDNRFSFSKVFLKDDKGNIYAVSWGQRGMFSKADDYIERYNSSLKQVVKKELKVTQTNGNDILYEEFFTFNGKPYIFGNYYNKTQDKRFLFAMLIKEDCSLDKPIKIAEFSSDKNKGGFSLKLSKDSSKLLIVSNLPVEKKGDLVFPIAFSVLDKDFKEIWKGKTAFPTDKKWGLFSGTTYTTVFERFSVDNKGRVFALLQLPREKASKDNDDAEYIYKLYIFENGAKDSKKFTIDLDKKSIYEFDILQTSKADEVVGIGSYSENKKLGWFSENVGTNGSFYFKINTQTGVLTSKSVNPFPRKVFEFMRIDEKEQKKGEGIEHLEMIDNHVTANNNILMSLEQNYRIVRTSSTNGTGISVGRNTIDYISGVMFNIKYDSTGKIIYQNYVPKNLISYSVKYGLEHILAPKGERHAMIFNDNRKNTEKELEDYKDMSRANPGSDKCVARLVTVDEKGTRKVSTLFSNKDEDFALQPNSHLQYLPGVIISVAVDGKKFKLVKIEY